VTETSTRKPRLNERRKVRIANSAKRQQDHVQEQLAKAQTPVDLLGASYIILRGRLVQFERKAIAALERARTQDDVKAAQERLANTRAEVERISNEAQAEMARLADEIHTERR
jgi:hypothetical protein